MITFESIDLQDTKSSNYELTRDSRIIIKNYNEVKVSIQCYKSGGRWADTDKLHLTYGVHRLTAYPNTTGGTLTYFYFNLTNIYEPDLIFTIEDSEGTYTEIFQPNYIDYHLPVIIADIGDITTNGNMSINYEISCWSGSFKYDTNRLGRIDWKVESITPGTTSSKSGVISLPAEKGTINVTGLIYKNVSYKVTLTAKDMAAPTTIIEYKMGTPMFDWSNTDFNFNVPVEIQDNLTLANDKALIQLTASGRTSELLGLKSDNVTYLNQGGMPLKVYGSQIDLLPTSGNVYLGDINLTGLVKAIGGNETLVASPSMTDLSGVNHASILPPNVNAQLIGNSLYIRFHTTTVGSTPQTSTGDITDQFLGSVSINHKGKIKYMDYVTGVSGSSGSTCGLQIKNIQLDSQYVKFEFYLCNNAHTTTSVLTTFVIPVALDLNKF